MDEIRVELEAAAAALRTAREAGDAEARASAQSDVVRLTAEYRTAQEAEAALAEADAITAQHRAEAAAANDRNPVLTADELLARQGDIEHARGTASAGDLIAERVRAGLIEAVPGRPLGWIPGVVASQQPAEVLARGGDEVVDEAIAQGRAFMAWINARGDTAAAMAGVRDDGVRTALATLVNAQRGAQDGPYAAVVGTGTTGVPIPTQFVPQPVDEMGEIGVLASRAERIQVTSAKGQRPAFGSVTANWFDDAATATESEQTNRLIAYALNLVGSYEDVSDLAEWASEPALVSSYIGAAMRAIGRAMSNAVVNGTGTGNNQPAGLAVGSNLANTRKVDTAANSAIVWADIINLVQKITSRWIAGAAFYTSTFNRAEAHNAEVTANKGNIGQAVDGPIAGYPSVVDDSAGFDPIGANGDYALFGNLMNAYTVFEPVGLPLMAAVDSLVANGRAASRVMVYAALDGRVSAPGGIALLKK